VNNILVYELADEEISPSPDVHPDLFCIEDNVGEAIHIHLRNFRLDLTIEEFRKLADTIESIEIED